MLFWGPHDGVATNFDVVYIIVTTTTPTIVAVGDVVVVACKALSLYYLIHWFSSLHLELLPSRKSYSMQHI
jgi:hypothetical protein